MLTVDIDECGAAECAEECINTIGSFYCSCINEGFEVIMNNEPCEGYNIVMEKFKVHVCPADIFYYACVRSFLL